MRPKTPEAWHAVDAAYAAVKAFPPRDQVTATAWAVVAVLSAQREKSKDTPAAQMAFDRTCGDTLAYLWGQIEALRFAKAP
jgi:hypothetical protein